MTVGIVLPSLERVALSAMVGRINEELGQRGYELILSVLPLSAAIRLFQRLQVDGIIVFEDIPPEQIHASAISTEIPILSIGSSHVSGPRYAVVDAKRKDAIKRAVQYLMHLGHHSIAFVGDARESDSKQQEKVIGFLEVTCELADPSPRSVVINSGGNTWKHGYEAGKKFVELPVRPTAVITGTYDITVGFLRAIQDADILVPDNLSMISYDNIPQLAELDVPITAVGPPVELLAARIATSLLTIMTHGKEIRINELLDAQIQERDSCRPI
jgi:LacI family transcriptional regulator